MQRVVVDGAVLPVLDLEEAGTFGGAAVLQRLCGRGRALGRRLQRDNRKDPHFNVLHCDWLIVYSR